MSTNPPPAGMQFVNPATGGFAPPPQSPAHPAPVPAAATHTASAAMQVTAPPPPSHLGWVVCTIVLFWPLAFAAANHSSNVMPLWHMGDQAGAERASARVRRLGLSALAIWGVLTILFILLVVAIYQAGGF